MDERVRAHGHEHVRAIHQSTLEVTSDDYLTPAGDCIVGIGADRTPADFDRSFVESCKKADARITATIETPDHRETIRGRGHPDLSFENDQSLVIRTSEYVDDRTVMVGADTAAAALDRDLVEALVGETSLTLQLSVE